MSKNYPSKKIRVFIKDDFMIADIVIGTDWLEVSGNKNKVSEKELIVNLKAFVLEKLGKKI